MTRASRKGKITTYPELRIQRLYEIGQDNGWDTVASVRELVTNYLLSQEEKLKTKAPPPEDE